MTRFQRIASGASLLAFLAFGTAAVAHAAPDAPAGQAEHAGRHGHGRGDLVRASLRLDSLTSAQRQQIEALETQEKAAHANVRVARGQLLEAVAAGVVSGNVDDVALSPKVTAVEGAIQADEPGDRATLEKLHAILTPAQRVELVSRVESHRGGKHEEHPQADAGAKEHEGRGGPWARELNLSDAQKDQIRTNLRSIGPNVEPTVWKQAHDSQKRVLEAFKGDRFVMNEVAPPKDARLVEAEAQRVVRLAKASAPVLTVDQRTAAAAKIRAMASHDAK